jgi:ribosome biogenesis GTPase
MASLKELGWENYISRLSETVLSSAVGRVRRVDRGEVDVLTPSGEIRAFSDSQRTKSMTAPVTGDWVKVLTDPEQGHVIDSVLPRYSQIIRRDPAEMERPQVLATNVDAVAIVLSADRPINIARIERLLILAATTETKAVLILTKADYGIPEEWTELVDELHNVQRFETSAFLGLGESGVRKLLDLNQTLVLLGESGVGKSTLVNYLAGQEIQETKEVRLKDKKGRHTTTAREMILIPSGGIIIDTPGIRGVGLWDSEEGIDRVFYAISSARQNCRFKDCTHKAEPHCAVQEAVREGRINHEKLERYQRLLEEAKEQTEIRNRQNRKLR